MRTHKSVLRRVMTVGVMVCGLLFVAVPAALAAAPKALSVSVPSVTPFEARLEGVVNAGEEPAGVQTECHFQYGTVSVTEHEVACEPAETLEGGEQGVAITATGLSAGTVYHFRVLVKNTTGEADSEGEFATSSLEAPIFYGESVFGVTATDAHLEAVLNPNYQQTGYYFEYASEEALLGTPAATTVPGAPPAPLMPAVYAAELAGPVDLADALTPGTTYYYRVVSENQATQTAGIPAYGPAEHFTTLAETPILGAPSVVALADRKALLEGSVDPHGGETSYRFSLLSQAAYAEAVAKDPSDPFALGKVTPEGNLIAGNSAQTVTLEASELRAGTTYHVA